MDWKRTFATPSTNARPPLNAVCSDKATLWHDGFPQGQS